MGTYATAAEIRAHPSFEGVDSSITDARIDTVMDTVERRIERFNGVSWTPRTVTEKYLGTGTDTIRLDQPLGRSVSSVTEDGDTVAVSDVSINHLSELKRDTGSWKADATIEVTYEHGHDEPPADLKEVAIEAACAHLAQSANPRVGPRTQSVDFPDGPTMNWAEVPGSRENRIFGMPHVDQVVASYGHWKVMF